MMLSLSIENRQGQIHKYNARSEMHGSEREPAADVIVRINFQNTILAQLDPELKSAFFRPDAGEGDLADKGTDYSKLRFGRLRMPVFWDDQMDHACVEILPEGETEAFVIDPAKVNNISAQMLEGGTVILQLRIQFSPDEGLAALSLFEKQNATVSVRESQVKREDPQTQIPGTDGDG